MSPLAKKLDSRSRAAVLLGYSELREAYNLLGADTKEVVISKDVTFDDNANWIAYFSSAAVVPALGTNARRL